MSGLSAGRVSAVLVKEFKQLARDRLTYAMMLMIPVIQLVLFGYAVNSEPRRLPTAVLAQEDSRQARSLVAALKNSGYFDLVAQARSPAELDGLIRRSEVQFAVTIPGDFSRKVARGDEAQILVEADATDPSATGGAIAALTNLPVQALAHDLKGGLATRAPAAAPFKVVVHRRYNPESITAYNIVPGLLGIILSMTLVMMTALSVTRETERGTMESLLATPVEPLEVMAGKLAPYCGGGPGPDRGDPGSGPLPVRRADAGRLDWPLRWPEPVHRGLAGPGLSDFNRGPHAASGHADEFLLHSAVDLALGLHVPVPGHAGLGPVARRGDPRHPFSARGPRLAAEGPGPDRPMAGAPGPDGLRLRRHCSFDDPLPSYARLSPRMFGPLAGRYEPQDVAAPL